MPVTPERVYFETKVHQVSPDDQMFLGRCSDLSIGGMYLKTSSRLDVNERVDISFLVPCANENVAISCSTRVAWINYEDCKLKPDYPPGVGLQFNGLSEEHSKFLSDYICAYDDNKKMNMMCAWCGKDLGYRKGPYGKTSHGICSECKAKHF